MGWSVAARVDRICFSSGRVGRAVVLCRVRRRRRRLHRRRRSSSSSSSSRRRRRPPDSRRSTKLDVGRVRRRLVRSRSVAVCQSSCSSVRASLSVPTFFPASGSSCRPKNGRRRIFKKKKKSGPIESDPVRMG